MGMRDGVRKRIWLAALAALAALGFVRGQITGGTGDGSLFLPFSGLLGYVGEGLMGTTSGSDPYGYAAPPPPNSVRADCVRLGIPTSLQVNQVGTTTSPFCPGVAGVWANAGGDWIVSLNDGSPAQQVSDTTKVRSGRTTTVRVSYTYIPPQPVGNKLHIVVNHETGEAFFYYNDEFYRPDSVSRERMLELIESTGGFIDWTLVEENGRQWDFLTHIERGCVDMSCPKGADSLDPLKVLGFGDPY